MQNGGQRNRQGGDVGQCVEVCRAGAVAHPQPFLSRRLKAGVVSFALCTQGVCSLETEAATVNGKPVIRGDDPVFNATPVFLPVIPVFVVTRANAGFGLTEWAAEFLPSTIIVGGFAIFVHSQSSITDQVTCRKSFALGIAFFEGDKSFPIIDRFHGVVDAFRRSLCWLEAEWTPRAQSGSLFGWFSLENLLFAKDFGLFCLAFAMTGVESRPINEASTIPIS